MMMMMMMMMIMMMVIRAGVTERVIAVFNTPENSITGKEIYKGESKASY